MKFLLWYDDGKTTPAEKIRAALGVFQERFGRAATVVWVSEGQAAPIEDIDIEPKTFVRPNNFWIGEA